MMWKTLPRSKTTNNIAYYKTGNGPTILMIHGVGLKLESWESQIQSLSKEHTVIAIDLPGHGDSSQLNPAPSNIDSYTQQIKLFVDEVIPDSCIVIGHSLGALIAIRFAHLYKNCCDGVVALNCIYQRTEEAMSSVKFRAKKLATEGSKNIISSTLSRWFGENPTDCNLELAGICKEWLHDNIQANHGALGTEYPDVEYLMEGDSPSFLQLIPNGLNDPEHPNYGGWGGRY